MDPYALFSLSGPLVMLGWALLVATPLAPRYILPVAGIVIPAILSVGYLVMILVYWSSAEGGFDSLASVMLLFDDPGVALAGWLHYLAFDLFVGAWIVRNARETGVPHLLVVPCLLPTFLFGPAGFVLYLALRTVAPLLQTSKATA